MTALGILLGALALVAPSAPAPDTILLLVGDAGKPARSGEPVLQALSREAAREPSRTTVVFLGDNIYPRGLPAPDASSRAAAERRLTAQLDAVRTAGVRAVFLPGNHDWDAGGKDGWNAVLRQAEFVRKRGPAGVDYLPPGGCPGPEVRDLGQRVRLVVLDTQWFLHGFDKPRDPDSPCLADSDAEVEAALGRALADAGGREVIVAAHHPLVSGGPHGGHFSIRQHVFPLTDWKRWLWLPLPGIGSIYPAARRSGVSPQDLPSEENRRMHGLLLEALKERPPLVWAAGHEHSLQVITTRIPRFVLVSGAGIYGHTTPVKAVEGSHYAADEAGFMRLVFPSDGAPRLTVLQVDQQGIAVEHFSMELK